MAPFRVRHPLRRLVHAVVFIEACIRAFPAFAAPALYFLLPWPIGLPVD